MEDVAHEHVLSLYEKAQDEGGARCIYCLEKFSGTDRGIVYECIQCSLYLHGSCAEAGSPAKLLTPFHQHPFQLFEIVKDRRRFCSACCSQLSDLFYLCHTCSINVHVECALLQLPTTAEAEEQIRHPCHLHPLSLTVKDVREAIQCRVCRRMCSGSTYTCGPCNFFMDKSCAKLPVKVERHPCHPFHALKLSPFCDFTCYACMKDQYGFPYLCHECDIPLDINCALFAYRARFESLELMKHESHLHPLSLVNQGEDGEELSCKACEKKCSGPTYCCNPCKFYLHSSCADLPKKITIFGDVHLNLNQTLQYMYQCGICKQDWKGFFYENAEESLVMDVECAIIMHEADSSGLEHIYHHSHCHPLVFKEKIDDVRCWCQLCDRSCSRNTYGCSPCNYFLHESCIDLPDQIEHPFHRMHPLKLCSAEQSSSCSYTWCKICSNVCKNFFYSCTEGCNFVLDIGCSSIKSVIKYDGHSHPLIFLEKVYNSISCRYCKTWSKLWSEFRCLECDFGLDLFCGPLPCTVEHNGLVLTLMDTFVEDNQDKCYCDDCDEMRDPKQCVYHSTSYYYTVELKCVMPEIILALNGEVGDIELRTIGRRIKGKVITKYLSDEEDAQQKEISKIDGDSISFKQILCNLDKEENMEVEKLRYKYFEITTRTKKIADLLKNSDEVFRLLMERLEDGTTDEYFLYSEKSTGAEEFNLVKGGTDYWISRICIPLHEEVLDRFGKIGDGCKFSPMMKTFLFHYLFSALCIMRGTLILNVTEDTLCVWWRYLRLVHDAGFQVEPLIDNLTRLVLAYFGLQVRKLGEDLDRQTAEFPQEISEKEAELERVKADREQYLNRARPEKTSLMKKCLSEASALKWKTVGELILD